MVVIGVMLVVMSVAIPAFHKVLLEAKETTVIREIHTIAEAQLQYQSQFGHYAATLPELDSPAGVVEGPQAAHLIPANLASGEKDGYVFTMTTSAGAYVVNANPKDFPNTGRRTFFMDPEGVIHENWGPAPATTDSPQQK